jgi:hypothetical protein
VRLSPFQTALTVGIPSRWVSCLVITRDYKSRVRCANNISTLHLAIYKYILKTEPLSRLTQIPSLECNLRHLFVDLREAQVVVGLVVMYTSWEIIWRARPMLCHLAHFPHGLQSWRQERCPKGVCTYIAESINLISSKILHQFYVLRLELIFQFLRTPDMKPGTKN